MPVADFSFESAIDGEDPAQQRQAILNDAQPQPPVESHPMVQFAQSLMAPMYGPGEPNDVAPFDSGTYTPPPQSPMNYQAQVPQGFNPYAAPPQAAPTGILGGINDFAQGLISPFANDVKGKIADFRSFTGTGPQSDYFNSPEAQQNAIGMFGFTKAGSGGLADIHVPGAAADLARGLPEAAPKFAADEAGMARIDLGALGPDIEGGLTNRIGGKGTQGVGPGADLSEKQMAANRMLANQVDALRKGGATEDQIAEFQQTMGSGTAPTSERVGTVTTAEGAKADAGDLTRSLQTAAGTEGVPLSQHPVFADYAAKGPKGPANPRAHGGDIGTATRAVMSGDPDAMKLLGDDLTDQLIQNKVAHIIRQTGAPEDVVRRGLGITMARDGAEAADAAASDIVKTGEVTAPPPPSIAEQNAATVQNAVQTPPTADFDIIPGEAPPVNGTIEEQRAWLDKHTRIGDGGDGVPPTGGEAPPATPEPPRSPQVIAKDVSQTLAVQAMDLFTNAQRASLIVGHLPLLRQALPMLSDAVVRGDPQEVALALGRTLQGLVSEGRFNQLNSGYADALRASGIQNGERLLTGMHGPISAREEFALTGLLGQIPVVSNLNRMYPAMLNSLRAGAALHLAEMQKLSRGTVDSDSIVNAVNELSGRGSIPSGKAGSALNAVFFGPKLLSATWQVPVKAVRSLGNIATDAVSHKPIDPVDVFRVRSLASYVATGAGLMKLANAFGLNVHADPRDRDWGRIDLPGGSRIDMWSGFGSEARLIAQTFETVQQHDLPTDLGGAGRPRGPYDNTAFDLVTNYLRGKLNPGLATVIGDYAFGKTMGGQAPSLNPLIPQMPLGIQAGLSSDPGNTPTVKGEAPAGTPSFDFTKALLAQLGAGVISTNPKPVYDGLGTAMGDPSFGTGSILQAYTDLVNQSAGYATKWHSGDPVMAAPSTTIGSGKNSISLDPTTAQRYVAAVGQARDAALGPLVNSQKYQQASVTEKQKMFDTTLQKADKSAVEQFLANDIIHETDPKLIAAEAVDGFAKQSTYKDKAYWVATLDRAGKLTPEARAAIDTLRDPGPDGKTPITVDEYLKAAPLVHEYLSHVPYGTDTRPIGTPQDWTAVEAARVQKNARVDELVRSGIKPTQADQVAQQEILRQLPPVQQSIFLRGTALENVERRRMLVQYPTLSRFLGSNPQFTQESDATYQNFPFGQ